MYKGGTKPVQRWYEAGTKPVQGWCKGVTKRCKGGTRARRAATVNSSAPPAHCLCTTRHSDPAERYLGDGVGDGVGVASNTVDDPVPIIAATAIRRPFTSPTAFDTLAQVAEVAEVQLVVEHAALASQRVAEGSDSPNCKPEIVRCAAPEQGTFTGCVEDTTGAAEWNQPHTHSITI